MWHTPYSPYFGTYPRAAMERQETRREARDRGVGVCELCGRCVCVNKGPACSCVPRLARINAKKLQASKQMRVREKPTHCDRASDVDAISSKGTDTEQRRRDIFAAGQTSGARSRAEGSSSSTYLEQRAREKKNWTEKGVVCLSVCLSLPVCTTVYTIQLSCR